MKVRDFENAWEAPGNATPNIARVWYNSDDEKLKAAVTRLRKLGAKEKAILRGVMFRQDPWVIVAPLIVGVLLLSTTTYSWPVVLAGPIVTYALLGAVAYSITRHLRIRHSRKLLRGGFGHAIMWNFEPAWKALEIALKVYQLSLDEFFAYSALNLSVTPIIAEYLTNTQVARGVLRQRGEYLSLSSESRAKLVADAEQAAMGMTFARASFFSTPRRPHK